MPPRIPVTLERGHHWSKTTRAQQPFSDPSAVPFNAHTPSDLLRKADGGLTILCGCYPGCERQFWILFSPLGPTFHRRICRNASAWACNEELLELCKSIGIVHWPVTADCAAGQTRTLGVKTPVRVTQGPHPPLLGDHAAES